MSRISRRTRRPWLVAAAAWLALPAAGAWAQSAPSARWHAPTATFTGQGGQDIRPPSDGFGPVARRYGTLHLSLYLDDLLNEEAVRYVRAFRVKENRGRGRRRERLVKSIAPLVPDAAIPASIGYVAGEGAAAQDESLRIDAAHLLAEIGHQSGRLGDRYERRLLEISAGENTWRSLQEAIRSALMAGSFVDVGGS